MKTFARKSRKNALPSTPALPFSSNPAGRPAIRQTLNGSRLQPKLKVGAPNDAHEQQADRVADQVMRMSDEAAPNIGGSSEGVQRVCDECQDELQRRPMGDEPIQRQTDNEEEEILQTKPIGSGDIIQREAVEISDELEDNEVGDSAEISRKERGADSNSIAAPDATQLSAASGEGKPLPTGIRNRLEPFYGRSFADVRVHEGSRSTALNQQLNARAFTYRNQIFFGAGEYNPAGGRGKHLLAHELTHVVQQGYAPRSTPGLQRKPATEVEGAVAPAGIMRQPKNCTTATRPIDKSKDIKKYNCTGLAFRDYKFHSPDPKLSKLVGPTYGVQSCGSNILPDAIKLRHWTYTFQNIYETSGGTVVHRDPAHADYHIVGGRADCANGSELANVYSKNGGGPISGPDMAAKHELPGRQFRRWVTARTSSGGTVSLKLITTRTGVKTTCYAAEQSDLAP
ncbi:MAG: DUF4157 domain-containing protein [Acidobacteriota bacterium]|nr:DUF4157 domain-containing protein [Acidobacteriota bacterium]